MLCVGLHGDVSHPLVDPLMVEKATIRNRRRNLQRELGIPTRVVEVDVHKSLRLIYEQRFFAGYPCPVLVSARSLNRCTSSLHLEEEGTLKRPCWNDSQ